MKAFNIFLTGLAILFSAVQAEKIYIPKCTVGRVLDSHICNIAKMQSDRVYETSNLSAMLAHRCEMHGHLHKPRTRGEDCTMRGTEMYSQGIFEYVVTAMTIAINGY